MGGWLQNRLLQIRRRQTPLDDKLYRLVHSIRSFQAPYSKTIHSFLYAEWVARCSLWHNFWRIWYYEPMFKSQCKSVGKGFRMEYAGNGSAKIFGALSLSLGDYVTIFDNTCFVGLKVLDHPEMTVGDHTYLGPSVRFMVGKKLSVGRYCLITSKIITDNPGHPIDNVLGRMSPGGGSPSPESMRPVTIGDFCFLPLDTVVYPGVTIGDGVVARVGTHLSQDVPPFCQVAGNPMRIVRKLPVPVELKDCVGAERYQGYLDAHKALCLERGKVL